MKAELVLDDGTTRTAERDPALGWYVVKGRPPGLGASVMVEGIRREVAVVAWLPDGEVGLHLIPDFLDPGCGDCAYTAAPPTPEWCRTVCGGRKGAHWF